MSVGETLPQSHSNDHFDIDNFLEQENVGDNAFEDTFKVHQEQYSDIETIIAELIQYYGSQQFSYPPYVGTFSDIVNQCPAINAQIMNGVNAVKSFLAGYEITDEQANELRNRSNSEEAEDEQKPENEAANETNDVREAPKSENQERGEQNKTESSSLKQSSEPAQKIQEAQNEPASLPAESAPEIVKDIEAVSDVDDGAAIVAVEEKVNKDAVYDSRGAANTIAYTVSSSVEKQQSIEAIKPDSTQKQESDGTDERPPVAPAQAQKIDREADAISKEVDEESTPNDETPPLPLSDILEKEHVATRATAAEIVSAMVPESEVDADTTPEVYRLPDVYSEDEVNPASLDEEVEVTQRSNDHEVIDDEMAGQDGVIPVAIETDVVKSPEQDEQPELTEIFHEIQSMEAEFDTQTPPADSLEIEMPEDVSSILEEYVEILPEVNHAIEVTRMKHRIVAVTRAIDTLETSTTAEECRESLDTLHDELAALFAMLGYKDGHVAATHIIERWKYDVKTLRQFIAALAKVIAAQESHHHTISAKRHRKHHWFGKRIMKMLCPQIEYRSFAYSEMSI